MRTILVAVLLSATVSAHAGEQAAAPYRLEWQIAAQPRGVTFHFAVIDEETGKAVTSPRLNTQTTFQITSNAGDTTLVISGKPTNERDWTLTLKASRDGAVIQESRYTASAATK